MKIEICEDDGFMNGGKPKLVVLVVTHGDGKQMRVPYEANKTIQQLYVDLGKCTDREVIVPSSFEGTYHVETVEKPVSSEIEVRDIVKCIKVYPRDGVNDLKLGDEYRVIEVKKNNGKVVCYEVVDDNAPAQWRILVSPEEVEFLRKAKPKKPKNKGYKDMIVTCSCGEHNAIVLNGGAYVGKCAKCNKQLKQEKELVK